MKRSFILIDHSIENSTGHYLEYARRVLRAARELGFRTVLGTNIRAKNIMCQEADVVDRAFTRSYWENQTIAPLRLLSDIARGNGNVASNGHLSYEFAIEICGLMQRATVLRGDLVFMPTLGGVELIGIAHYSKLIEAESLDWHLLFRRDLPIPTNVLHGKAFIKLMRATTAFKEFYKQFEKGKPFFYTDTDDLTKQYNELNAFNFSTLPIPIDDSLEIKQCTDRTPLIVSYLGDAREEKGIHLLPEIIRDIRVAGLSEASVRFRIQVNQPIEGSNDKTIAAIKKLNKQEGAGLEIVEGPFDSDKYSNMITSSDVILIPYHAKSYQARSSGIFAEALAAGVPTIFPRGSWMDRCHGESGSIGFNNIEDISVALIEMLVRYPSYESRSLKFASIWRQWHSATNLVQSLKKTSNECTLCAQLA